MKKKAKKKTVVPFQFFTVPDQVEAIRLAAEKASEEEGTYVSMSELARRTLSNKFPVTTGDKDE